MIISVTQEDIDQGKAYLCSECPIARAAKRALPDATGIRVYNHALFVEEGPIYDKYALPERASTFVYNFDMGGPHAVSPFEFICELEERIYPRES